MYINNCFIFSGEYISELMGFMGMRNIHNGVYDEIMGTVVGMVGFVCGVVGGGGMGVEMLFELWI